MIYDEIARNRDKYRYGYKLTGNFPTYRTALENNSANILVIGDSVTEGLYATLKWRDAYGAKFRDLMKTKYGDRGFGYVNPMDERFTYAGSWVNLTSGGMLDGINRKGSSGATGSIVTSNATSITVIYNQETDGATVTLNIDGTNYSINTNGAHSAGMRYVVNALPNTAHTVTLTVPTGANSFYFLGLILDIAGNGVQVHQIGKSGQSPYNIVSLANVSELLKMCIDDFNPHLTILAWGDNEPTRSPDQFQTDIKTFVDRALTFGDVLLLGEPQVSYNDRVLMQRRLADKYSAKVGMVDMYTALKGVSANGYFSGGSAGTVGTNGHPSNAGHLRMAKILYGILN